MILPIIEYPDPRLKKVAAPVIPKGYNAVFEAAFRRYSEDIQFGRSTVSQAVDGFLAEANAGMGK